MPRRNLIVLLLAVVVSIACYERATRSRYIATLAEALHVIEGAYVEEVDKRVLFEGAMHGMLDKLDTYSSYIPPEEFLKFKESIDQEFGGIGIFVEVNPETKRLTVMSPLIGTPAHKAGLKQGDTILKIGDVDTTDMSVQESVKIMRGPIGSSIKLTILHLDEQTPREFTLDRAKIVTDSVYGDTRRANDQWDFHLQENPKIGLIRIGTFGERTTVEMQQAFATFRESDSTIDGLIVDLRGNSGGLLPAAVDICDMFLDSGVIVSTRGRGGVLRDEHHAQPGMEIEPQIPVVVLVDRFSASASEIVAACLQDHERAVICGERTWGKGTVQNLIEMEGRRSALRITTATYWRPSEKNIHKTEKNTDADDWGVTPNPGLEVSLTNDELAKVIRDRRNRDFAIDSKLAKPAINPSPANDTPPVPTVEENPTENKSVSDTPFDDPQLRRAIEYLTEKMGKSS
jgi:carboxyl-terminal processing protease